MKMTLEFDDENEAIIYANGMNWALCVHEIMSSLRQYHKYGHQFEDVDDAIEKLREEFYEIMQFRNVSLDMII